MAERRQVSKTVVAETTETIRLLAAGQHGVVGRRQLTDGGISTALIDGRIDNGRLLPVFPGVYAVGTGRLSREGRLKVATLAGGATSLVSHRSAAALHGLIRPGSGAIEVLHEAPRRKVLKASSRPGTDRFTVLYRCTRRLPDHDRHEVTGIPVTSVARTLLDLAGLVSYERTRSALLEAERLRVVSRSALEEVIGRGRGWSGVRNLRNALSEIDPGELDTKSGLEVRLLRLCRDHGLPAPLVNVPLRGFIVDFYWPSSRLVVETDTFRFHGQHPSFRGDRSRDVDLMLAGYRVARFTDEDLFHEPHRTVRKLKALLEAGQ